MNRPLPSRAVSLCVALALPCLLSACSSQAQEPAANAVASSDTTAPVSTPADAASPVKSFAPPQKAGSDASSPAAPATGASYKEDHQVPPGMTEAQMKKVWVPLPPASFKVGDKPRVKLTTSKGDVVVTLDPKAAPLHTRSFVYLATRGFFDNTIFHRWADLTNQGGAIIQGGDPLSRSKETLDKAGQGGPGYTIPREHNALKHDALVIAAARTQDPDSAGSQFYITQAPVYFLDEGDGYTVFGHVTAGADVAKKLRQDDKIIRAQVLK